MSNLLSELKRRNVFKVGVAYLALGWVVIQVTDVAVPALNLPETLNSIVVYLGLIGFPFALFFAWAFELTPDGLKRSADVSSNDDNLSEMGRKLEHVIVVLLVIALSFMLWTNSQDAVDESRGEPEAQGPSEIGKSIAVLPFVNMSEDKDYFADGLSEELLNLLAKNRDLKVAARTSSFAFKGENRDLRKIGAELSVATVLEGSVRRSGDRIRITAQLINVADGYHLWSETYDREMVDIFDIQDEVSRAITTALKVTLSGDTTADRERPTNNLEAYSAYLEGLAYSDSQQSMRLALTRFDAAVALDPDFTLAWELRADAAYRLVLYNKRAFSENLTRAHSYVIDALAIDPNNSFLKSLEIGSREADYDWYDETVAIDAAAKAEPSRTRIKLSQNYNLMELGYRREALEVAQDLVALDPLNPQVIFRHGTALAASGQMIKARVQVNKAVNSGVGMAAMFAFVDRLRENDAEGAIAVYEALGKEPGIDLSAVRALVEAEFRGDKFDTDLAATVNLGVDIKSLFDLGRGRLDIYIGDLLADNTMFASSADILIFLAMAFPDIGYTAHPDFIKLSMQVGTAAVWDRRGAPDMCTKTDGEWVCT